MQSDHEIEIDGIPCGAVVQHYKPGRDNSTGHIDSWLPDDDPEVEFYIVDRKGRHAPWLEEKMTLKEKWAIEKQIIQSMQCEEL
jgi:hypothetical protein